MRVSAIIALAVVAVCPAVGRAGLVVLQVESTDSNGFYAPLDFGKSNTIMPAAGAFAGLKFFADSGASTTGIDTSAHAAEVGEQFYGKGSPARAVAGSVSAVHAMNVGNFLNTYLRPPAKRADAANPAPKKLPGNPKVLNASFTGSSAYTSVDLDLLARTNLVVARDGVLMVAGAVTSTEGTFKGTTLIWGAQNVLAVRGSAPESVFDPSNNAFGKSYTNVWAPNTASMATGAVSSMGTALLAEATTLKRKDAATPAALRALIMAGADRTSSILNVQGWSADLANGLDHDLGAGEADYASSKSILESGKPVFTATKGTLTGPFVAIGKKKAKPLPTAAAGVTSFAIKKGQTLASLISISAPVGGVTATLTWDIPKTGQVGDLLLDLRPVTLDAKGNAVLSAAPLLSLDADGDNIRHIASDTALVPGLYAWVITNQSVVSLTPAFAFDLGTVVPSFSTTSLEAADYPAVSIPLIPPAASPSSTATAGFNVIPEPTGLSFLICAIPLLRRRHRR